MTVFNSQPQLPALAVVLIATRNRSVLLGERALNSILRQDRLPDLVLVVDDSQPRFRHQTLAVLAAAEMRSPELSFKLLVNQRAPGASGAWNTGLRWLAETYAPATTMVLLLDDDDAWRPNHVAECMTAFETDCGDVVATGMTRIEREGQGGRTQLPPEAWAPEMFLAGNPHIQASNLAVRLSALLEAGMFDEAAASCTDRDLCLRLLAVPDVRYQSIQAITVDHFAEPTRARLSTPGSRAKQQGLDYFWRKYRDRMDPDTYASFLARNGQLFGWRPPGESPDRLSLVVGIIADASVPERVAPLLEGLLALGQQQSLGGLDVVIIENGPQPADGDPSLQATVAAVRGRGLRVWFVPLRRQQLDARDGVFGAPFERTDGRAGIAVARTMLQAYLYALARRRPGCVGWILDDDKRIAAWSSPAGSTHLVDVLLRLRADGVAVALGVDAGAPPLPALATLRGELLDLQANLAMLAALSPEALVPDRGGENGETRRRSHSAYYDLAQGDGRHLEAPFWWQPKTPGETAIEALAQIADAAPGLLRGAPIFRAIPPPEALDPVMDAKASTLRGGCTWLLDIEVLAEVPNLTASIDGDPCRRSDMVWSALLAHQFGRKIVQIPLAVAHDRAVSQVGDPWRDLLRDVRGHAIYLALEELLRRQDVCGERPPLNWSEEDLSYFDQQFQVHLKSRLDTFEHNSLPRIPTLLVEIRRYVEGGKFSSWLQTHPAVNSALARIAAAVADLEELLEPVHASRWLAEARGTPCAPIRSFAIGLNEALGRWRDAMLDRSKLRSTLDVDREANARGGLAVLRPGLGTLALLGAGDEGVVLTDGQTVFKWFDWLPERQRGFLHELAGRLTAAASLPRISEVIDATGHTLVSYPLTPSVEYRGGHGPALVALLQECRAVGIVCNNLHPKNLRLAGENLMLIDVGVDIVPWSSRGWKLMCRRAFLCWRWWFRSDLNSLMTRSLTETDMPELSGFAEFIRAVDDPPAPVGQRALLVEQIKRCGAKTALDYGCGPGRLDLELAKLGVEVVAYDPDDAYEARWRAAEGTRESLRFGGKALLEVLRRDGVQFDVVVCSLVLCVLPNGPEYEEVLADLRRFCKPGGEVLVAVCNPFATLGAQTAFTTRAPSPGLDYDDTFAWPGTCCTTGRTRDDVHRPLRVVERDLLRHGLVVDDRWLSDAIDLERFEPAADFLFLSLRLAQAPPPGVTLAIKTCAMEWRTLEEQVRHLSSQLEGDFAFAERLLAVDSRRDGFPRQHDEGDEVELDRVIARLLRFGLIDRVVTCPADQAGLRSLAAHWFGLDCVATHAVNGNPVATTLAAFRAVQTPYVLQVDSDLMVRCSDPGGLRRLVGLLEADAKAVTASLSLCVDVPTQASASGPNGPWRTEVRGCLVHLERLSSLLPLPNSWINGQFAHAWHRALDMVVYSGAAASLRVGDPGLGFVHPQNDRKLRRDEWMTALGRCEAGYVPGRQLGNVDMQGPIEDWLGPKRAEPFVVVMQGRNVPPGRLLRAIRSVQAQARSDWGAILMDDGSDPMHTEFLRLLAPSLGPAWTILRTPIRRGGMANLVWAVRHVCTNPWSVVVTVDQDDALIGSHVLDRLDAAYGSGADLTVGAMLRTDKEVKYQVQFAGARRVRGGGCVWQHLRSFRKRLFDEVPDSALQLDGRYVDIAQDWAFMLAMVELATQPVAIEGKLYLYEPWGEGKGADRAKREDTIGRIVAMAPLKRQQENTEVD